MKALKDTQSHFQEFLLDANFEPIIPEIKNDHLSREKRLDIYYQGYRIRLYEVLKADFSNTCVLMGEEDFRTAFAQYLAKYPS